MDEQTLSPPPDPAAPHNAEALIRIERLVHELRVASERLGRLERERAVPGCEVWLLFGLAAVAAIVRAPALLLVAIVVAWTLLLAYRLRHRVRAVVQRAVRMVAR